MGPFHLVSGEAIRGCGVDDLSTVPEKNSLEGGKLFLGFQFKVRWVHCFGPEVRQDILVVGAVTHCLVNQEPESGRGQG